MVKAYPNQIEVWINGHLVVAHTRLYGRKQESLDLRHYLPILAQKGRAIRFARPVQKLVPASFIDGMEAQHLSAKEMVEMLYACQEIGYQAVMRREKMASVQPLDPVPVPCVDLSPYDQLYAREAAQ